jgi:hypothetical protein
MVVGFDSMSSPFASKAARTLLFVNTVLFLGIVCLLVSVSYRALALQRRVNAAFANEEAVKVLAAVQTLVDGTTDDEAMAAVATLFEAAQPLFMDATSAFLLGSINGTVAGFVSDTLSADVASVGTQWMPFAFGVANNFMQAASQYNTSEYASVGSVASIAASVSQRVGTFVNLEPATAADPALSDGVFRLNTLLQWIASQADPASLDAAAKAVVRLSDAVAGQSWNISYVDDNGVPQYSDVTHAIHAIARRFNEVGHTLAAV